MSRNESSYAPQGGDIKPVVEEGEFPIAAAFFNHGHIYGQIDALVEAGAQLRYVYDPEPSRYERVLKRYPNARPASSFGEILDDSDLRLVTAAAIPNERCLIGIQVMESGKDYLTDKAPFTSIEQLNTAKAAIVRTGRRYMVYYSERLANEASWHAGELIKEGAIGKVIQVANLAPHRLSAESRPDWFFRKEIAGGILTDIGSHQCEQFLAYSGAVDGAVQYARVDNVAHPMYPEFEDYGEANVVLSDGSTGYCRLDWFTPEGAKVWGDGRCFVLGTKGYLEIRKYRDIGIGGSDRIYLVNDEGEHVIDCRGKVGRPFFGAFILDCLNGTETAMTQAHALKAAELSLKAQAMADRTRRAGEVAG
ncbi:Gfo/Idh/MocA family oxidoreductase [Pelagicoccus sp. SDUM812003]|uniref:Gfo/Idh/MocA family protein n=1 Tax=Pelagicoccus sp. SDUM812003 TaxID=3041267 RepID=UPI00280C7FD6|nr:Gfo/Idh/MocA family oxidoreductase [Pelagicoccus sp. SDUM812003]MDQ8203216.1 Gfo/Idh/MocA family oxidoreductase [Pelagicoccus sp. SDUM812003]